MSRQGGRNGGTAVAVRTDVQGAVQMFEQERAQLALVLPNKINQDRFLLGMRMAIEKTPKLLECDPASLLTAGMQAAELGLYVGGAIPHAHLVPFWDNDAGVHRAQLIPDYRGLIYLAVSCGAITKGEPSLVYKGDTFQDVRGSEPRLVHDRKYLHEGAANVICGYFMAWLPNGERHWRVMTKARLLEIKRRAMQRGGAVWKSDEEEMYLKTLVKYGLKTVPIGDNLPGAAKLTQAIAHDNEVVPALPGEPDADELPEEARDEELCRLALEYSDWDPMRINQQIAKYEGDLPRLVEILDEKMPEAMARAREEQERIHGAAPAAAKKTASGELELF